MSLLDDVSIVVTPNGYKAGTLFGVIPVPTEGSEEITNYNLNGNFSDTSALHTWISGFGGSFAPSTGVNDGSIRITSSGGIRLNGLYMGVVAGKLYKVSVLASTNTGTALLECSGDLTNFTLQQTITTTPTTFDFYVTYSSYISFVGTLTSNILTLDDISVKEFTASDMDVTRATAATRVDENGLVNYAEIVGGEEITNGDFATDTDWNKGTGITIGSGVALFTSVSSGLQLSQSSTSAVSGKTYKISYEIKTRTEGAFSASIGGALSLNQNSALGVYTEYLTATGAGIFYIRSRGTTSGSIDNVSVKEVTRDNVPRIDYTGGGCPHILAEPQRTNLVTYSSDFNDSSWNLDGNNVIITRTPNATTSPSGEENATKLIGNNTSNDPSTAYIGVSTSAAAPYTTSIFAKKGEYDYLVSGIGTYAGGYYAIFNLSNGTVSTSPTASGTTASIEDYGNGWYRCLVNTTNTGGFEFLFISPSVDGTLSANYTNTTNGIYVWGGQVENGSYATSYIPTSGSSVTRNQDIFTRDGIGSLINSTEGVLFVEMAALSDDNTDRRICLNDGSVSNEIRIGYSRFTGNIIGEVISGGSAQNINWGATGVTQTNNNKFALSWGSGTTKFYVNGSQTNIETGITSPIGLNTLKFSLGNDTLNMLAEVKQLQVYDTALTDNQLIQLTGEAGTHFFESYAEMAEALTYTIQ